LYACKRGVESFEVKRGKNKEKSMSMEKKERKKYIIEK
jgi:hypothetical protein